jgi:hypothetical protein
VSVALLGWLAASCGGGSPGTQARWKTAERVSPPDATGSATPPAVAIDSSGNATALWHQEPEGTVWAARRTANGAWEPPTLIDTQAVSFYRQTPAREVAMDAAGDAVAVWGGQDWSLWASWSGVGAPWTAPVRLTESGEVGLDAVVALDPAGAGFAVWQTGRPDSPGRETRVRARRVAGGRWQPAQDIQLSFAETGGHPQVAVGIDGTGVAVWDELRNGVYRIWGNSYRPAAGWNTAEPISPDQEHEGAIFADVGADALGNAMAVWMRSPGGPLRDIEARRFDVGRGWGTLVTLARGRPYPGFPRVAVDASGNALAVWLELPDSGGNEVWAAWFAAGLDWGPAQRLQSPAASGADAPGVAMDARGNGFAAWRRGDGDRRIVWAARFQATSGWGSPEPIGTGPPARTEVGAVAIALSPGGDGVVAWQQWDGTRLAIWANRFAASGRP